MYAALFFLLGLIAGSCLNVIVWRMHKGQGFIRGRSCCEACGHDLYAKDLVPVLSWISLKGHCRYCGKSISWQHPAIELTTGLVFAASYIWWPLDLHNPGQGLLFGAWLLTAVGLIALAVYDLRWMLLPNKFIYPTLLVTAVARLIFIFGYQAHQGEALISWLGAVVIASGLFLLLFLVSRGRWIGYGDVRLGLITGTVLASPTKALLMIFIASILGSLVAAVQVALGQKKWKTKIAYGPYLITGTFLVLLFGQSAIDWYNRVFMG